MIILLLIMITVMGIPIYCSLKMFAALFLWPFRRPYQKLKRRIRTSPSPPLEILLVIIGLIRNALVALLILGAISEVWVYLAGRPSEGARQTACCHTGLMATQKPTIQLIEL